MFILILALLLAAVVLAVLAYLTRHRATLGVAAVFALGLALHFALAQLGALVHSVWSSWFGA